MQVPSAPGVLQQVVRGRDAARRIRRAAAVAAILVLRERQQRQVLLAPLFLRARRLLLPLPAPACSGLPQALPLEQKVRHEQV